MQLQSSNRTSILKVLFRLPVLLGVGFAVLIAGVVWFTLFRSDAPDYQARVEMPGMGVHMVNLWVRPVRDGSGTTLLVGQVTDSAGMPVRVSSMDFTPTRFVSGTGTTVAGGYSPAAMGQTHVFTATTGLDLSSAAEVRVNFTMAGVAGETVFSIDGNR